MEVTDRSNALIVVEPAVIYARIPNLLDEVSSISGFELVYYYARKDVLPSNCTEQQLEEALTIADKYGLTRLSALINRKLCKKVDIPSSTYRSDFMRVLFNVDYSDVVLIANGNERIPVNKYILADHSEYFNTMFESGMLESRQNEVRMHMDVNVLEAVVEFVYTDWVSNVTPDVAVELYTKSHELLLPYLTAISEAAIRKMNLTESDLNVLGDIASMYNSKTLSDFVNGRNLI